MDSARLDDLATRARQGDRAVLAELFEATRPVRAVTLRRYAWRGAEGPLEVADLEQESFLILSDLVQTWRGQGPFIAWLRRLFPLAILRYRRSLLHWDGPPVQSMDRDELSLLLDSTGAGGQAPDPFDTVLCRQLLAELPPAHRCLLLWRFADGLSYREIERLHRVPAATAQVQCERALAYLRAKVGGAPTPALSEVRERPAPNSDDAEASVRALWALGARHGGLLPPAAVAAASLHLGRRAYDHLVARLVGLGCLGTGTGVSFASRQGRRRRLLVDVEEALRRLSARAVG